MQRLGATVDKDAMFRKTLKESTLDREDTEVFGIDDWGNDQVEGQVDRLKSDV